MKKSILALFLLALASHGTWCTASAESGAKIDAQEVHETEGKKLLEVQSLRKLSLTHRKEVGTVEKHPRRMAIGHKGGSTGGGGGSTGVGGGGAASETRPHNTKSTGASAAPVPMISILTLVFASAIVLSAFRF